MNPSHQPQPQDNTKKDRSAMFMSSAIILLGVFISCAVLIVTGSVSNVYDNLSLALPKFTKNQNLKDLSTYDSVDTVLNAQPKLSFNSNAKYLLVEVGEYDCLDCATMHGFNSLNNSYTYKNLYNDFISKGKVDYMFIDNQTATDILKQSAAYCAAEQDTNKYFKFNNSLLQNVGFVSSTDKLKSIFNESEMTANYSEQRLTDCINGKKYANRVIGLTGFSENVLGVQSTPTLIVFSVQDKTVKKLDGSTETAKTYSKLFSVQGSKDYQIFIKPEIEKVVAK